MLSQSWGLNLWPHAVQASALLMSCASSPEVGLANVLRESEVSAYCLQGVDEEEECGGTPLATGVPWLKAVSAYEAAFALCQAPLCTLPT